MKSKGYFSFIHGMSLNILKW